VQLGASTLALAALVAVSGVSREASADWSVAADARTSVYQDTDHTFISTTAAAAKVSPVDFLTFKGRYIADVVTSASIDVVSSATKVAFDELRHEGAGSVSYQDGTRTANLGYVYSVEHDWRSHSVSGSFANDFFNHQLTVGIGGSFTTNDVGRADDPNFHRALLQGSVSLNVGLVATKRDLLSFDYTLIHLDGYQASPYRFARILSEYVTIPGVYLTAPEGLPEGRTRHALAVRWNRAVGKDSAVKSHLRGYVDDWGIRSITGGVEVVLGFGPVDVGVFTRGYAQTRVDFYQPIYDVPRRYMTSDKELATFVDAFGGLRIGWAQKLGPFEEVRAELKGTGFAFHFFDFPRLPQRYGIIAELAIGATI
jgi:hypothetical protein